MIGGKLRIFDKRYDLLTRATALLPILAAGCVSGPLAADHARAEGGERTLQAANNRLENLSHVQSPASFNPDVPTPESIIGHAVADGAVRYDPLVRYLQTLAEASPLATLTPYAESHEGRTLYYLTITSIANHARLDEIKADNAKLADPRRLASAEQAAGILDSLPGVAWLAYSIHGDELSSTDAAIEVAYQLTAGLDEQTRRLRDELVIHIDPLMNPDGRERYLGQLQHLTGKVPNPDYQAMQHWGLWSAGRGNHYLFDLNRDWLMQVHPETRGRAARLLDWNPHLVVDSHEMGSLDTYLFDPPREPHNVDLSEDNLKWRRRFSADQAKAFDRHGWSYYTQEWYEEWYPGYTNAWVSLQGAVGLLYEQAGVNAAVIKQATGKILTYREAVHHQFVSSLANLETLRANRREILADYLADRRWAVQAAGSDAEVFLLPPPPDRPMFDRFVDLLIRQGIEVGIAPTPLQAADVTDIWGHTVDTKILPAGTLVVRAAQPRRRLLHAILNFDPHMSETFLHDERKYLESHRGTRVYDVTAWNLCMAYGLEGYWARSTADVALRPPSSKRAELSDATPGYGYLIDGASSDIYHAIIRLLDRECKVRVATEPFTMGGQEYAPGAVLLRNRENPAADELSQLIKELTADLDLAVRPVDTALCEAGPDLGGRRFRLLAQPRIAIASQWPISTTSFGSTWHLLDARLGLRVSPFNLQAMGFADLRKYNVIVLPNTWRPAGLEGVLNERTRKRLKKWVETGGTLVALGNSAAFVAGKDRDLSSVRLRRDVLDKLTVYEEALKREQSARHVSVDPAEVWNATKLPTDKDDSEASDDSDKASPKRKKPSQDIEALKREDTWLRMFSPNGVMAATEFNPEHWLCFGLGENRTGGDKLSVLLSSRYALMSKHPIQTPVRLAAQDDLRLSGLLWPEGRKRWADTAYTTVERVGYGQIILFSTDPFFRGYLEGTGRLLLNALLLGPGLGTSQPVPW